MKSIVNIYTRDVQNSQNSSSSSPSFAHELSIYPFLLHIDLSSASFPHVLAPNYFRSFSTQSNHHNFRFYVFILLSGFPRYTFFTVLSSDILTT
jgi:hypothetical protein